MDVGPAQAVTILLDHGVLADPDIPRARQLLRERANVMDRVASIDDDLAVIVHKYHPSLGRPVKDT